MTGKISVFTNIRIRVDEASKLSWLHHWLSPCPPLTFWTQRSKQYLGEGFSVDLIQGPQVDFFLSDESRVGRSERALSVPLH